VKDSTFSDLLKAQGENRVFPVIRKVFSDSLSPLRIFESLADHNEGSFLLESAEQGVWSRFSFVGVKVRGRLVQEESDNVNWISSSRKGALPADLDLRLPELPLEALALMQSSWANRTIDLEVPLTSGLIGSIGWDVVRELEELPLGPKGENDVPRISFSLIEDLVVIDHRSASLFFISNIFIEGQTEDELRKDFDLAQLAIDSMILKLSESTKPFLATLDLEAEQEVSSNLSRETFVELVEKAKEFVRIGDVFQVVLSQRFQVNVEATALEIYRVLRALNPSPYMYLLNGSDSSGGFSIVGASPESLVTVSGNKVTTHPIAGSRPRGKDWEEDHTFEIDLLADLKETSEHLMLVDLARNDLLKVCKPDSVTVTEFMQVHRFSHIMHLVSTVEGELSSDLSPIDVFRATFPAGTLSGAPKPRALEIITALEPTARGLYGGVVGYFDFSGNSDLAIAIRTAVLRNGVATIQAGAGIVLDSNPDSEYEETKNKARASLRSIAAANSSRPLSQ
jgi:anthranilate synthase component 1